MNNVMVVSMHLWIIIIIPKYDTPFVQHDHDPTSIYGIISNYSLEGRKGFWSLAHYKDEFCIMGKQPKAVSLLFSDECILQVDKIHDLNRHFYDNFNNMEFYDSIRANLKWLEDVAKS